SPENWDPTFQLAIGNEISGDRPWKGTVHSLAILDRALTVDEIRELYADQSARLFNQISFATLLSSAPESMRSEYSQLTKQRDAITADLRRVTFDGTAHVIVPHPPGVVHRLERGQLNLEREEVTPHALTALTRAGLPADLGLNSMSDDAARRTKLAEWLTDPRNPFTARVFVNRIWQHHFGRGIVETPSDFGFSGSRPSHPELLDYLARDFMDHGWDLKRLHRQILLSRAYQQSSTVMNPAAVAVDADNRLLWRANPRRLDGEEVRDAILMISGALNPQMGGPGYRDVMIRVTNNHEFTDPTGEFTQDTCRRTIYRLWARSGNLPMLQAFDCPDPSGMVPLRPATITPLQALSMLNSPLVGQCAEQFATHLQADAPNQPDQQLQLAWQQTLGRQLTEQERTSARALFDSGGLQAVCLVLFNSNEFLFVN
ncbi:MAG: DUF1553 domain-containing protein, partial [Planctomycetaceae bacterium]|nr:DUF1553 domain-containing protein [Planctomycetaceae bacterium]